jgi:hypothetical protein
MSKPETQTTPAPPTKGEVWIWQPDNATYRSVLVVTQVTSRMVRTKRNTGGKSFWNPICHFVDMARRVTPEEVA